MSVYVLSEKRLQGEMQSGVVEEHTKGTSTCALDFKGKLLFCEEVSVKHMQPPHLSLSFSVYVYLFSQFPPSFFLTKSFDLS